MAAWLETAVIAFIVLAMGFLIWRGGAANPVGTGTLQSKVNAIDASVKEVKAGLARTTDQMKALETSTASRAEFEALTETLKADRRRTEQVFLKIENVEADLTEMRAHQGTRDVVIEALSKSVQALSKDLRDHQIEIAEKLDQLNALSGQVTANARAIEAIVAQLPALRDRQAEIAARQAETASDVRHVRAQVDRLYDFLTEKALK